MMKKKQIKKSVHASFRPVLKKSAAFVLTFAVIVSAFTGFFPIRAHAEDTATDKGLVTNLVDQKSDLQKGVSIADTTKTDIGASYFWKSDAADWTANISYDFKIPLDKIQAGAIDKNSTYDLGLPTEMCAGVTASSPIPVTAYFTKPVNIDSNSNSQVTSYPTIAQISISSDKATLTFNQDTSSLKNFYTSLAGTSDMEDYLPELKFSISSSISQSTINSDGLSAVPLYFGETGRQASYFTLDLQFPDSTKSDPMIDLSGQQITQTQTVSVDNQKSTFTEVSTGEIEWKAVITTNNCLESGLDFKVPLNGQTYDVNSYSYNDTKGDSSTSATLNTDPNKDGQLIVSFAQALKTYGSQITITYRTKPAADSLQTPTYSSGQATTPASTEITGNVSVGLSGGDLAKTSAVVPFSQTWLRKKGTYNPSDQTIYWELIFNENGRTLTNAVLHDTLDQNQTLVQQQVFVSTAQDYGTSDTSDNTTVWKDTAVTTEGNGFQIHLSDKYPTISTPLYISYLTKVKPSFFDQENAETAKISNDAHVEFTTEKGEAASFGPGPQSVTPGVSPISKQGVYNPSDQTIKWTVTLNEAFAEWTHVTVTIPIDTVKNQLYLDGIHPSNQTTAEDTNAATGIAVQTGSFDAHTNQWSWSDESENKAAVTVSTTHYPSGETAEATSTITVQWANPVSTLGADELDGSQYTVTPIKAPKQITFTTHLVNATDYSGNTPLPTGNNTSSIKPYNITPHLVVNPGPDPAEKLVNTADTNPTSDSSGHQDGRFVVTSYQKDAAGTDKDVTGSTTSTTEKLISGYQYEKWDVATDAASFAKDADKNSVQAYSQMLSCNVVNATNNPYNYRDKSLEFQLTVNQNMQSPIDGYFIQDTLPQNMEYKDITSAYTTTDGGTTKTPLSATDVTSGITESSQGTSASDPARQTVKFLFSNDIANSKTLVFTFKVQFPDDNAVAKMALDGTKTKRNFTLQNDAELFDSSGAKINADVTASTDVDSMMISKTILKSNPNTHRIQYQILVNKVGAALTSGGSIPIIDTLPEGMQLISGSVSIRTVAIAPDGSYDAANSTEGENSVLPTKLSSTGTNYNYQISNDSSGTPHGVMTVNLNGDYLTKPCMITYEIEVGTLIQGGEYANVASYNGEEDSENSGGNVRATTTLQSVDEATSLATSDRAVVKIQKTDKDTGVPLAGAHFAVYCKDSTISMLKDPGDNKFAEVLTNSGGYAVFRLPLGNSYQIKEIDPPSGYTKDTNSIFSNDGAPITLSSSDGGVVYQWDGSKFTSDADTKTVPITNQRNDNSSITFYVQTNPSQSSNSASSTSSTVSSENSFSASSASSTSSASSASSQSNSAKWAMGTMPLHGAGAITSDLPGHPLKGAVYGLYVNDSCDTPVKDAKGNVMTATSDSNGKLEFTNLAWGAATPYYIREITPPKLFQPRSNIFYKAVLKTENDVTFSGGDLVGSANQLIISYDPQNGDSTINVKKVGEDTGDVGLAGARFDLYTKAGDYFKSGTTISGTGIASLPNLPAGDYTLKEAAPPSGYAAAGDQDISVGAGETNDVKVTDTIDHSSENSHGHITVQMKFDKSSDDQVVRTERNFIIRLQKGDRTPLKGAFTYQRSDGKSGTLNFDTDDSSSSSSSSITNRSAALRRAGGFSSSDSTAVLPMKGNTDAIVNVPNGTYFTIIAPEISGYDLKKSGDVATVSPTNKEPASFDYTKQAGTDSSSSNSSGSPVNSSRPSSNSGTSSNASPKGTNPSGGTTSKKNAGAGTQTGSSGTSKGTNGTASGTSGTNGAAGSTGNTGSVSSAVKSNSSALPKTNVPDTLPFWSIGLALSSIATVLVIRWGIRKRKRERNRRDS